MTETAEKYVSGEKVTENIRRGEDGVYRWVYELDMLKDPSILISVWKVLGISFGIVYIFVLAVDLFSGGLRSLTDLWDASKVFVILAGVFFVISVISYLILAALYGGKYRVLFEMTDEYVKHIQIPEQFGKAKRIGELTMLAGALSGKPAVAGLGRHTASKNESVSEFARVENVKVRRKRNTINVNYLLDRNKVYAADADFDFVESFILERCVKAKVKKYGR